MPLVDGFTYRRKISKSVRFREKSRIAQNRWRHSPILQITGRLCITVIKEIFKLPPHLDLFCQINYLLEFS